MAWIAISPELNVEELVLFRDGPLGFNESVPSLEPCVGTGELRFRLVCFLTKFCQCYMVGCIESVSQSGSERCAVTQVQFGHTPFSLAFRPCCLESKPLLLRVLRLK